MGDYPERDVFEEDEIWWGSLCGHCSFFSWVPTSMSLIYINEDTDTFSNQTMWFLDSLCALNWAEKLTHCILLCSWSLVQKNAGLFSGFLSFTTFSSLNINSRPVAHSIVKEGKRIRNHRWSKVCKTDIVAVLRSVKRCHPRNIMSTVSAIGLFSSSPSGQLLGEVNCQCWACTDCYNGFWNIHLETRRVHFLQCINFRSINSHNVKYGVQTEIYWN